MTDMETVELSVSMKDDLRGLIESYVDNLTKMDVAREANNDIIKEIKGMGINPSLARKAAKIVYEQNKDDIDMSHQELMGLVDMCS